MRWLFCTNFFPHLATLHSWGRRPEWVSWCLLNADLNKNKTGLEHDSAVLKWFRPVSRLLQAVKWGSEEPRGTTFKGSQHWGFYLCFIYTIHLFYYLWSLELLLKPHNPLAFPKSFTTPNFSLGKFPKNFLKSFSVFFPQTFWRFISENFSKKFDAFHRFLSYFDTPTLMRLPLSHTNTWLSWLNYKFIKVITNSENNKAHENHKNNQNSDFCFFLVLGGWWMDT